MKKIVLSTLNARYIHSSIGLRYIYANLQELQKETIIKEFVINEKNVDIAEKILSEKPKIVGLSVYIWNASDCSELVDIIKKVSPETIVIVGGPEVSHLPIRLDFSRADYIIQGEADFEFYNVAKKILGGRLPQTKLIKAEMVDTSKINLPYQYYTDHDIAHRVIYVETSRGCPFNCEFCLSSIDKNVRYFDIQEILNEFETLWQRGARHFKFIDRTFNLNIDRINKVLDFFLSKEPPYLAHFEMIPENFPGELKEKVKKFPPAALQFEIGIQTLNPETACNINRKLNFEKIDTNLAFLQNETKAHLHVDLIVGLPGETIESFADNLNKLKKISKCEIQIGILKKLSGTSISRHDENFGMVYSDLPPYEILKNNLISFYLMQRMKRFARFWDMIYNSGNFNKTAEYLWKEKNVFDGFFEFSEWLFNETESTWQISLNRLSQLLFKYLTEIKTFGKTETADLMVKDILQIEGRKLPSFLRDFASEVPEIKRKKTGNINKRQMKHL